LCWKKGRWQGPFLRESEEESGFDPVGVLLFVICGITRYPFSLVTEWVIPFLIMDILVLAVCSDLPIFVMWVPKLLGYV
jgi:TRAP-type C4-dicarboxylate transport system permease large subunit